MSNSLHCIRLLVNLSGRFRSYLSHISRKTSILFYPYFNKNHHIWLYGILQIDQDPVDADHHLFYGFLVLPHQSQVERNLLHELHCIPSMEVNGVERILDLMRDRRQERGAGSVISLELFVLFM